MLIAIAPDRVTLQDGTLDSSSDRWVARAQEHGVEVTLVNLNEPDVVRQMANADGFMHRFLHSPDFRNKGRRIVAAVEQSLGIPVFPNHPTSWHYDDKVAQKYLLEAAGIPIPATWVWWSESEALTFLREASFPLVLKLAGGASSQNVLLVEDERTGQYWIERLFGQGVYSLAQTYRPSLRTLRGWRSIVDFIAAGATPNPGHWHDLHKNYVLFQEFLPSNAFDTRVTVIGDRAFGFRRFNRPNDFRSSGSGLIDPDPSHVDSAFVRLAFEVARSLGTQSVAIDGLWKNGLPVVGEISYTFLGEPVARCPGHWVLHGEPPTGELEWIDGHLWPEDIIFDDFVERIRCSKGSR